MDVVQCQRVIFYNNLFRIRLVDELLKTTLNVGRGGRHLTSVVC